MKSNKIFSIISVVLLLSLEQSAFGMFGPLLRIRRKKRKASGSGKATARKRQKKMTPRETFANVEIRLGASAATSARQQLENAKSLKELFKVISSMEKEETTTDHNACPLGANIFSRLNSTEYRSLMEFRRNRKKRLLKIYKGKKRRRQQK